MVLRGWEGRLARPQRIEHMKCISWIFELCDGSTGLKTCDIDVEFGKYRPFFMCSSSDPPRKPLKSLGLEYRYQHCRAMYLSN
jgi:hypothetical protein